jgi:2-oxoglutarate ferredoxin oxidoreductase subunit beta
MDSLLNTSRPPVFCPGCTHETITKGLDAALVQMGRPASKTVIVSDIGCSGLFDTFFNVHALHGLHGRALTYATGLKLADPELNVVVTMGDGGLGIGAAHLLAACRKNLALTLIVLNNFNFGMTGGQYSGTTPSSAVVGSQFLNQAEAPLDICTIAKSAGATWIRRCSGHDTDLKQILVDAMNHNGFALVETLGLCTGRYTKTNRLTPRRLDEMIQTLPAMTGRIKANARPEYGEHYRNLAQQAPKPPELAGVEKEFIPPSPGRQEILILGSAGMRIVTAGEILCTAGMSAGLHTSIKNDYNITVLRGQSVSELILSPEQIRYTGIDEPDIVIALSDEGVQRRSAIFSRLRKQAYVLKEKDVHLPDTPAQVESIDFRSYKITQNDWALASLGLLAREKKSITARMLDTALKTKFTPRIYEKAKKTIDKIIHA